MTTPREHAVRLAVIKAIEKAVEKANETARASARSSFVPSDRITAALPDGTVIGSVTLTNGRSGWKVVDERAFLEWVREHRPSAIVEAVRASDQKSILDAIGTTGEVPDGVEEFEGQPYFNVRPDYAAVAQLDWRPYLAGIGEAEHQQIEE